MKSINNLNPKKAIIFNDGVDTITLVENETEVQIITDGTEHKNEYQGLITFVNEDGIEVESSTLIFWDYVKEINIK